MTKEDEKVQKPEIKMTKFVFIIIGNISMERFCTAGVLTILPLFLHQRLFLDHNTATAIFHTFECMMLFFTVFGAVISDTWLGLYRSVILMSCVYIVGLGCVSTSMIEQLNLPVDILVSVGLIIMLIGSGSLKNSLNAFGGSQHKLPEQKAQLEKYFSVQYLGVKTGSFLARILFPMLRGDVKCFGKDDCYSLTFGIPMIIMIFSLSIFLIGRKKYIKLPPNGNMLVKVIKCIKHALTNKPKSLPESEQKQHWLEYSEEKYGKKLVMETKIALKVVLMSLPVPIFWACLMQQRSRWIFQAVRMNGDVGWYTIKPDQMIVFNSLLSISLIPILDKFIYPIFEKIGIKTMLQRLIFGGILIVVAFILSAILETQIQNNYISILWQLPQFIVISIAEIFTYLSHLNFAYKEAPPSMKPVMMSLLYLSMAGGDLIIAIISAISFFPSQTYEYAFYACFMLVDVIALSFLARSYSRDEEENKTITNNENDGKF
ncbi:hypothetical protein PVAND_012686 [Polypedilum vanderplanki]|uniref:Uncharacterized protein n=1 Tax=Polypedilum vanderplanki TaxID=319348 RepID=A0A9J6CM93_POLVA|nr:hypothetical protein PVAND_012686 [Polypedilum vanderplanki]